jgi:GNAT superfamily N-acetyltransferase
LDALRQNVRRSATGGELGVATVREYAPADREPVLAVFQSNVPEHFAASEDAFLRETMASPDGPLFVVVEAEKVVGFGGYEVSDLYNQGVLVWGMIRADRHKRGLGRLLLAHRLEHMAAAGNRPRWVVVVDPAAAAEIGAGALPEGTRLAVGPEALDDLQGHLGAEAVIALDRDLQGPQPLHGGSQLSGRWGRMSRTDARTKMS